MRNIKVKVLGLAVGVLGLMLTGCNTSSSQVRADYVSPFKYDTKSCAALKNELIVLGRKISYMTSHVDNLKHSQDTKLALGWLFWPSYLIIDDNKAEAKELGREKGEYEALKSAFKHNNCKNGDRLL